MTSSRPFSHSRKSVGRCHPLQSGNSNRICISYDFKMHTYPVGKMPPLRDDIIPPKSASRIFWREMSSRADPFTPPFPQTSKTRLQHPIQLLKLSLAQTQTIAYEMDSYFLFFGICVQCGTGSARCCH